MIRVYSDCKRGLAFHLDVCGDVMALAEIMGYEVDSIGMHGLCPVVYVIRPPDPDTGELVLGKIYQDPDYRDYFWFEGWRPESFPEGLIAKSWNDASSFNIKLA